ncbi:bromodomain and WD repeat-containing DDB_G0285837 [Octopus bimaculoides]|nr:bromodomain and WD repeat-containing DDB_G0285837 [Octopus bimaculoides]|eukprot:XP_014786529.1 PREDICTED: homeobox protein 2-like [Octopus bimaculoides]
MYTRLDPEIEECLKQCQLQNSASPMTKQYLKLNILNKRHANGLNPINTTFTGEKKYQLRPDEEIKKEKRREQNRRAAARCRNKKKWEERLSQANLFEEEKKQIMLKSIVRKLTDMKQNMEKLLSNVTDEVRDINYNELYGHSSFRDITQNWIMQTYHQKETYEGNHMIDNPINNTPAHTNTLNTYQQPIYYPSASFEATSSVNVPDQKYDQSKISSNFNGFYCFPGSNNLHNSGNFNSCTDTSNMSPSSVMSGSQHSLPCYDSAGSETAFDWSDNENSQTSSFANDNTNLGSSFYVNNNIKQDDILTDIYSNIDFGAPLDVSNGTSFTNNIDFNAFPRLNSNINYGTYINISSHGFLDRNSNFNFGTAPVNNMQLENTDFIWRKTNCCNQNMDKILYLQPVEGSPTLNEDILYKIEDIYPPQCVQTHNNDLSYLK